MKTTIKPNVFFPRWPLIALILTAFLLDVPAAYPQIATGADLRIVRVDEPIAAHGRGALLVQVQDLTAGPIADAEVTFTAGTEAGDFTGGRHQITVLTDPQGIARAEGFQPSKASLPAEILVDVRYKELSVSRTLYYNVPHTGTKHWKWIVLAGAAGAAAVAAVLATRGNSTGSTSGGPVVVQVGTPTLSHLRINMKLSPLLHSMSKWGK